MQSDISDEIRLLFEIVNLVCLCSVIATFGIATNVVNMIIFYKQGFKNTVNIGFFGLAIADTSSLLSLLWASICMNPLFPATAIQWFPMEVYYLTAGWPVVCFSRITGFITVYITAERYLSIALPLKVKNIITPRTATSALCVIYFVNLASIVPEYSTSHLGYRFFSSRNETLVGIIFTSSRKGIEVVVYVFHFILGVTSYAGVILFTALLVFKLGQSSNRRKGIISDQSKHEAISARDKKTVKMVVFISCVLIVCYSPGALISLATVMTGAEFTIRGRYVNIGQAMWTTAITIQSINSSVNIFIYYYMSSKYRHTFDELMNQCRYSQFKSIIPPS